VTEEELKRENEKLWRVIRRLWRAYWVEASNGELIDDAFLPALKREGLASSKGGGWKLRGQP